MNRLTRDQRAQILNMQIEGVSIRATCRLTGRSKGAVTKLVKRAPKRTARLYATCDANRFRLMNCGHLLA